MTGILAPLAEGQLTAPEAQALQRMTAHGMPRINALKTLAHHRVSAAVEARRRAKLEAEQKAKREAEQKAMQAAELPRDPALAGLKPLQRQVLAMIRVAPGCSGMHLAEHEMHRDTAQVLRALRTLARMGLVERRGRGVGSGWHAVAQGGAHG